MTGRWVRRAAGVAGAVVLAGAAVVGATGTAGAERADDPFSHLFSEQHTVVVHNAAVLGEEHLEQACDDTFPVASSDWSWCQNLTMVTDWVAGLGEPNGRCLHVFWGIWQPEPTPSYTTCEDRAF